MFFIRDGWVSIFLRDKTMFGVIFIFETAVHRFASNKRVLKSTIYKFVFYGLKS